MELKGTKTEKNLMAAFAGESQARNKYTYYASKAKEEGFTKLAFLFEEVAKIEKMHEERYRKLLKNVQTQEVFAKTGIVMWECANCGHIHIGEKAPEVCPVCAHPKAYFMVHPENF